jgi:hypothetical protein
MPIDAVVANVHLSIGVPGFELATLIKNCSWLLGPDELFSLLAPKFFLVVHRLLVLGVVNWVGEVVGFLSVCDVF